MRATEHRLIAIRDTYCLMLRNLQQHLPASVKAIRLPRRERYSLCCAHLRGECCEDVNNHGLRAIIAPERLHHGAWEVFREETHITRCSTSPAVDSLPDITDDPQASASNLT